MPVYDGKICVVLKRVVCRWAAGWGVKKISNEPLKTGRGLSPPPSHHLLPGPGNIFPPGANKNCPQKGPVRKKLPPTELFHQCLNLVKKTTTHTKIFELI